jgi:O-antigen/teichoic acid export membrane protein
VFQLLHYATRNFDNLIIGRCRGAHEVGLHSRAHGTMMLPHVAITLPLQRVMISTLSRLQNDRPRFEKAYLRAMRSLAALTFPFGAGLYVLAEEAVHTVLGPRFAAAVPIVRVLALGAMLQPLLHSMRRAFLGLGRARQLLRFSLFTVPLLLGSFVAGIKWGALGVAVAYTAVAYVVVLPLGLW